MAVKHTCPLSTWHERFAHTSNNTILKMSTLGLTDGLNLKNSSLAHNLCVGCKLGKMTRLPFPIGRLRATTIGSLIHSDVCGPMEHPSPSGARYFVTFKDDHSGWCSVHFMKTKTKSQCFSSTLLPLSKLKLETTLSFSGLTMEESIPEKSSETNYCSSE